MKKSLKNKLTIDNRQLTTVTGTLRFLAVAFMLMLSACGNNNTAHEHDTYTCPMHPTVISDRPGSCPVCGMDLVRKARAGEEVKITEDLAKLLKSPNETVVASIRTIKGQYKSLPVTVSAQGVVTYDTRKIFTIPARVGGRLERIYLEYEFQPVSKGQKVAEIYSPELITAQRELVFLLENDSDNAALIDAARSKLELLGMSAGQINDLAQKKEARNTISIYSSRSGYLITSQEVPSAPAAMPSTRTPRGGMNDGMGASASSGSTTRQQPQQSSTPAESLVREGDYVTAGQTLFTVVNADALRIELSLPGNYTGAIREGSKVQLDPGNNQPEEATVDFIQPFFSEGQEFMRIRVYTNKTQGLHIGHLIDATIHLDSTESLWVPNEAVLDLGTQQIVFLKDRGVLKPKEVITGITAEGQIEIKKGLASSDEIAENAHYLVDSESFVKPIE